MFRIAVINWTVRSPDQATRHVNRCQRIHPTQHRLNQCNGNTGRYLGGSSARLADKTTRILVIHCEPPLCCFCFCFCSACSRFTTDISSLFLRQLALSCVSVLCLSFPVCSHRFAAALLACDPCLLPCWAVSFVQLRPVAGGGFPDCNLHRCSVHYLRADVLTRTRTSTAQTTITTPARLLFLAVCLLLFFLFLSWGKQLQILGPTELPFAEA